MRNYKLRYPEPSQVLYAARCNPFLSVCYFRAWQQHKHKLHTCKEDNTDALDVVVPELGEGAEEGCQEAPQDPQHHTDRAMHDLPGLIARVAPDCDVYKDGVARDGNHVIKAGCRHHQRWDSCKQEDSDPSGMSKMSWLLSGVIYCVTLVCTKNDRLECLSPCADSILPSQQSLLSAAALLHDVCTAC